MLVKWRVERKRGFYCFIGTSTKKYIWLQALKKKGWMNERMMDDMMLTDTV